MFELLTACLFGLRHGLDSDHIAAISDLSGLEPDRSRSFRTGFFYAFGHAAAILALALALLLTRKQFSSALDLVFERIVGATLVLLGLVFAWNLAVRRDVDAPVTRGSLLLGWIPHRFRPSRSHFAGAFVIGIVHGIGIETPTQMTALVLAYRSDLFGAYLGGLCIVLVFIAGMIGSNLVLVITSSFACHQSFKIPRLTFSIVSIVFSITLGARMLALHT